MNNLERTVVEISGEDPDSPDVFLDTTAGLEPIRDSLNDAIQEITMLTAGKKEKYYLPLRKQQMFYRFSIRDGFIGWVTDAWSINRRRRLEQTDLMRLSTHDPRWMVTNAEPRSYFQIGIDVLGFYPKPSSDTNVIELSIMKIPSAYKTSDDRINLRSDFEYAAVNYAAAEYWASRGNAAQAAEHMRYYLEAMGLNDNLSEQAENARHFRSIKGGYPQETA